MSPKATHPETAVDVLTATLARDGAQVSATTAARQAADPFLRLGPAAAMYYDALITLAELALGAQRWPSWTSPPTALPRAIDAPPGRCCATAWPSSRSTTTPHDRP